MPVGEGKFVLYSRIEPPLEAGTYRLTARQELTASGKDGPLASSTLPVAELPTHLRVRSPRFALPPDQVLSTFPPAASEGSYAMRLPQVVIKRRTLPWERLVAPGRRGTPWLALVVIAEGEAELRLNQPVAQCVTPGVTLEGPADAEVGHCLHVRRSVVDRVFPTRLDVPLLAHAREVDVHDTELMMGDDDGFLAVVIANRLPMPGRDAAGAEVPVKYLACLVNLEGQFDVLLERAPPPSPVTVFPIYEATLAVNLAGWDHVTMGSATAPVVNSTLGLGVAGGIAGGARGLDDVGARALGATSAATPVQGVRDQVLAHESPSQWTHADAAGRTAADVYAEMARPFGAVSYVVGDIVALEPTYQFPVLLHWSFTSTGDTTFRSLVEGLDSGLLGTVGVTPAPAPTAAPPPDARPPLEVVETGHVGLAHRTRRGDAMRAWYRGPCVPHPTADPPGGRLELAHAADQLRIVVPDGREDLSLAAAFEIGRLLALARPSMIAALLRWRQTHYQTARRQALWSADRAFLDAVFGAGAVTEVAPDFGVVLGRLLAGAMAERPATFLGSPRPLVDPGRPLALDGPASRHIAAAFAIPDAVLRGDSADTLARLRNTPVVVVPQRVAGIAGAGRVQATARTQLTAALDQHLGTLLDGTLGSQLGRPDRGGADTPTGGAVAGVGRSRGARSGRGTRATPRPAPPAPDALDRLVDALASAADRQDREDR